MFSRFAEEKTGSGSHTGSGTNIHWIAQQRRSSN